MIVTIDGTPEEVREFLDERKPVSLRPAKAEACGIRWSKEELKVIDEAPDFYVAVDRYREKFPQSVRNDGAIRKKYWERHPKGKLAAATEKPVPDPSPEEISCERDEPEPDHLPDNPLKDRLALDYATHPGAAHPAKTRGEGPVKPGRKSPARSQAQQARGNKYGIPSELSKTDLKLYQRLWYRCSSKGIMYEDAMKMESQINTGRGHKKSPEPSASDVIKNTAAPPHTEIRPSSGSPIASGPLPEGLKIGDVVRQTGGTKIFSGTGKIIRAVPGSIEALVRFDHGQEWIRKEHLQKVPANPTKADDLHHVQQQ